MSEKEKNPMREIRIEKLTLNIGAGKDQRLLEKGRKLLKNLTGIDPVVTRTNKRLQAWGLRPGLPIGCKLTIRDAEQIKELLPRLLDAKEKTLSKKMFDNRGTVSFGIPEYIDITGAKYDPDIGIIGFQASVTLQRPGFRIKRRRLHKKTVHGFHQITQEQAIGFMKEKYEIKIQEEEETEE